MSEQKPKSKPQISLDGKTAELEVLTSTMGEKAVNVSRLKADLGGFTYDPGMANTCACRSAITYVDGEKGILRLRGYPIEVLTENCSFVEVSYLLIHGALPNKEQRNRFSQLMNTHSMLHEDMRSFFGNYPEGSHPMAVLSAMVVSLSSFYPAMPLDTDQEEIDITTTRLLSKLRTIAAFSYKKSIGEPYIYPSHKYNYSANFLNMMFRSPVSLYKASKEDVSIMNKLLILHADHEQNASTTAVRLVGSTGANLYASIAAGICALWGPLHGGANQAVIEMLEAVHSDGLTTDQIVAKAKDKNDPFHLMGFGHRVYKSYDPRAIVAKELCKELVARKNPDDPLLDIALGLEDRALSDAYFQDRNLYPNVDFYTGLIYRALGFPKEMFTVLFALGRLPGWIAQWQELHRDPENRIMRPRQIYTGPVETKFVPIEDRP